MTCFMSTAWRLPCCHGNQPARTPGSLIWDWQILSQEPIPGGSGGPRIGIYGAPGTHGACLPPLAPGAKELRDLAAERSQGCWSPREAGLTGKQDGPPSGGTESQQSWRGGRTHSGIHRDMGTGHMKGLTNSHTETEMHTVARGKIYTQREIRRDAWVPKDTGHPETHADTHRHTDIQTSHSSPAV